MPDYGQKKDQIIFRKKGTVGSSTKPGIFLFRSGSVRDHTTAVSASVPNIIAITCSANTDGVLNQLTRTGSYAIITITSGSNTRQKDTRLVLRYLSASFELSGSDEFTTISSVTTDDKMYRTPEGKNDYYIDIPIKYNDDSFAVAYKTVNALNRKGNKLLYTASLIDTGDSLLNVSSSLGENMVIGSTFKIRSGSLLSGSVDVAGKFTLTSLNSGSVADPDFSGTNVQVGGMRVGSTFKVGSTTPLFQYNIIQSGSGRLNKSFYEGDPFYNPSYSLAIEFDDNDKGRSAFITGSNQSASLYFSGSGQMGVGTTNPKSAFDIKADDFKVRSRDGKREVRIQADGRLSARQFAGNTGVSESLGGVVVLSYSPGTFEDPTRGQPGETVGTIIFADESLNASASIADVVGSGSVAQIKSTIRGTSPLGGGGVFGDIEMFCNLDSSTSSSMVPFFRLGPQMVFENKYGAHFPFAVSMSRQVAIGNELASQGPTPNHALVVNGNVAITGSLELTGAVTSSIISSSILFSSGSNIFGDDDSDSHTFNGHITASGNISASGNIIGTVNGGVF